MDWMRGEGGRKMLLDLGPEQLVIGSAKDQERLGTEQFGVCGGGGRGGEWEIRNLVLAMLNLRDLFVLQLD